MTSHRKCAFTKWVDVCGAVLVFVKVAKAHVLIHVVMRLVCKVVIGIAEELVLAVVSKGVLKI